MELTTKLISDFLIANFFKIWLTILFFLIGYTFIFGYQDLSQGLNIKTRLTHLLSSFLSFSKKSTQLLSVITFSIFLAFYGFIIVYKQNFANYDNDIFTDAILKGYPYYPPIWPLVGRFFPLGHQEWYFWKLLINSQVPSLYFTFSLIQLSIIILLLLKVLNFLSIYYRLITLTFLLTLPSFFHCFDSLTIPERNLIFWLVIFILAVKAYDQTKLNVYGGIILIVTQIILYYKEPVIIFLAIFSLSRLSYFIYQDRNLLKQNSYFFWLNKYKIEGFILILCSIFVLLYLFINLPYQSLDYATSRAASPQDTLLYYIKSDLLVSIFLIVTILRFIKLIISKKSPDPLWDAIALGMLGYFIGYFKLGLINTYYLAPVDLIAILYISKVLKTYLPSKTNLFLFWLISSLILIQNITQTPKIYLSRLNFIDGRVQITEFLKDYSQKHQNTSLYFPYAEPHQMYYFSCFLKYKKLNLAETKTKDNNQSIDYILTSPLSFSENNTCVEWNQNHHCFSVKSPKIGDLMVVLPESEIDQNELSNLQKEGVLLFEYKAFPANNKMNAYIFKKI